MSDNPSHKTFARIAAKAVIYNQERKILLIYRSASDHTLPNSWDLPGGIINFGETPENAIKREILEEVGLNVVEPQIFDADSIIDHNEDHLIILAYLAKIDNYCITLSYEHNQYLWITPDEALKLNLPAIQKRFIQKAIKNYQNHTS